MSDERRDEADEAELSIEGFRSPAVEEQQPHARARTLEHMKTLLAGATASIALAGCSSGDATKPDAGASARPVESASPATSSSADAISPSAVPSSSAPIPPDAGPPDAGPSDAGPDGGDGGVDAGKPDAGRPVVRPPQRKPSGYEVVDMLPPPPFFFRRRKEKKKPEKKGG